MQSYCLIGNNEKFSNFGGRTSPKTKIGKFSYERFYPVHTVWKIIICCTRDNLDFARLNLPNCFDMLHKVGSVLDSGGQCDLITLDISRAFDTVDHDKLIFKLQNYGVHPRLCRWYWYTSFLTDRLQSVLVEGAY